MAYHTPPKTTIHLTPNVTTYLNTTASAPPLSNTSTTSTPQCLPSTTPHVPQPPSTPHPQNQILTFVNTEEVPKFKGLRATCDEYFTPGPTLNEFVSNLEAYFHRHNLHNDQERINALKILIHPSQGDARFVLSHIVNNQLNETNLTYNELINYIRRAYTTKKQSNFFQAVKNFLGTIQDDEADKDFVKINKINDAIQLLMEAYKKRPAYANNQKTMEQTLQEMLTLIAFSTRAGEKASNEVLEKIPANQEYRKTALQIAEFIKKEGEKTATVCALRTTRAPPPQRQGESSLINKNLLCTKCGWRGHMASRCRRTDLFCKHCRTHTHMTNVCRRKKFRGGTFGQRVSAPTRQ